MARATAWLFTTGAFVALGVVACSSSSGGGGSGSGSCGDMSGSWTLSGDCQSPSSCNVTQSGCTATLSCSDGTSTQASVNGNSMAFTIDGSQCSGSVTNGTFTGTCSASGATCNVSAVCSGGKCGAPSGSGGSGGTGPGEGGTGGVPPGGSGGTGGSNCSDIPYSNDPVCESCMQGACCSQMGACSTGTPCYALLECYLANCQTSTDENCLSQFCSEQLASGGPAAQALYQCSDANCAAQCASDA